MKFKSDFYYLGKLGVQPLQLQDEPSGHWLHCSASSSLPKGEVVMPKLAIVATIEVAPERRDQLLPLLMAHRARCLKDEPETLQFEVLVPREDDAKVLLYEVYRDDAAFDVHLNGPHIERVREEAAGMILKLYGTRCLLVE
jgi:(4S)-4-hydroxy-5-phosphonooxypentane-2,3-dione isomerase